MPDVDRDTLIAVAAGTVVLVVGFLWLHGAPMLFPHQGVWSVLAADSLRDGRGFEVVPDLPFAKFGPFYPLVLALSGAAGLSVTASVYLVNCLAMALSLVALRLLARRLAIGPAWTVLGLFAVCAPNYYLLRAARPEPIVICASLFAILAAIDYGRKRSAIPLVGAAVACAVAATTRYMAVLTLLPVVFLAIAWYAGPGWGRRLRDLSIFSVVSAGPIGLWLLRNYRVTGLLSGMDRDPAARAKLFAERGWEQLGLWGNVSAVLETLRIDLFAFDAIGVRDVVHKDAGTGAPLLVGLATLIGVISLGAALFIGRRRFAGALRECATDATASGAVLVAIHVVVYVTALVVIWTRYNNDPIETRYVAPIYPFLALSWGWLLARAADEASSRRAVAALLVLAAAIAAPNLGKSVVMMTADPPGPRLMPVAIVGHRGPNWVKSLEWDDLDPYRPVRVRSGSGVPAND